MILRTRSFLRSALLTATLSATALGCGKKEEPKPTASTAPAATEPTKAADKTPENEQPRREPEGMAAPDAAQPPAADAVQPAATGIFAAPALSFLPKDAIGFFVAVPQKVADGIGLEALLTTYASELQPEIERMQEKVGKNLFQLATWKEIGVDLNGPAGIASLSLERGPFSVFVTLSDAAAFRKFLDEMAKKAGAAAVEEKVGDASVFAVGGDDRAALLIRGNVLMLVGFNRGNGATALAKELATLAPEASLTASAGFRAAVKDLPADEGGGFVQLGTVMQMMTMGRRQDYDATVELQRQLDAARTAGNQDEIGRLERNIADEKRWAEERRARRDADQALMQKIFGDLAGLGAGIDITAESVEASLRLPMAPDALMKKLLQNVGGGFSIVKATKDQPLVLAAAKLDLAAYMSFVEQAMKASGEDLGELKGQMQQLAGVDFDKDVLGLFSGEVGFAMTGDVKALMSGDEPWAKLGGGLVLGLANPDGMKALLGKVTAIEQLAKFVKWDAATSTVSVPVPMIDKPVLIQVAGSNLVITADPELAARVGSGDASVSFVGNVANGRLKELLARQDQAGVFMMPQSLGATWLMAAKGASSPYMIGEPTAPEAKAKYDEYVKLQAEVRAAEEAREKAEMEALIAVFDRLGVTAEAFVVTPDGLSATIGQYVNGTVPAVVADLVKLTHDVQKKKDGDGGDAKVREQREKLYKLEDELRGADGPRTMKVEEPPVVPVEKKAP